MLACDLSDDQKSGFIYRLHRNLNEINIIPKRLRLKKVYPVFFLVLVTLSWIEFEFHSIFIILSIYLCCNLLANLEGLVRSLDLAFLPETADGHAV